VSAPAAAQASAAQRREFVLDRLRQADGPTYGELCRETVEAFPEARRWRASAWGVRAVRLALWHGLAITEPDQTVWLTERGWARAGGAR
jgi:hypothetical protein